MADGNFAISILTSFSVTTGEITEPIQRPAADSRIACYYNKINVRKGNFKDDISRIQTVQMHIPYSGALMATGWPVRAAGSSLQKRAPIKIVFQPTFAFHTPEPKINRTITKTKVSREDAKARRESEHTSCFSFAIFAVLREKMHGTFFSVIGPKIKKAGIRCALRTGYQPTVTSWRRQAPH